MQTREIQAGVGWVRRLRAACAVAFTLVAAGFAAAAQDAAAAGGGTVPLAYHAIVVNGAITGSSFQIADGFVLTNAHVVGDGKPGSEMFLVVDNGRGGVRARARVLAISPRIDVAILRVAAGLLPVAPAADAPLGRGREVVAAGVIADRSGPRARMELSGRITSDVVVLAPFGPGLIAEMPGIRRGFSGGPVFDRQGRLVGMVAALRPDPGTTRSATGTPLAGREAFVLIAPAIRAEVARLLAEVGAH